MAASVIDCGYRGQLFVALRNLGANPISWERGSRLVQLIIEVIKPTKVVQVEELEDGERGAGAFGSTGAAADVAATASCADIQPCGYYGNIQWRHPPGCPDDHRAML